jgi:predicted Zn-dependent protease
MVNFNDDVFDTWESACKQISEFSGVSFVDTKNESTVFNIILTEVLQKISNDYPDIFINLTYADNGFSIFNESNSIIVKKTISKYNATFNQVIFNGLLEFIQRYKAVK